MKSPQQSEQNRAIPSEHLIDLSWVSDGLGGHPAQDAPSTGLFSPSGISTWSYPRYPVKNARMHSDDVLRIDHVLFLACPSSGCRRYISPIPWVKKYLILHRVLMTIGLLVRLK